MMMNTSLSFNRNKRLTGIIGALLLLLLIPLAAMQFTDEVNWKVGDFLMMGSLLLVLGLLCELVLRKVKNTRHRMLLCAIVVVAFLLTWAELAVGIFGTPFAGS